MKVSKFLGFAAFTFFLAGTSVNAAETKPLSPGLIEFNNGHDALEARNYEKATALFREAAEKGNADAQNSLGWMYDYGQGVPEDKQRAVYWYRKAAEQGNGKAQTNLGVMYSNGQGVPKDSRQAAYWSRKAAEQGYARGQAVLGLLFELGSGVPKDIEQALHWYREAAEQDNVAAQYSLASIYEEGQGVPQDHEAAYFWLLILAANEEDEYAAERRDSAEKKLNAAQIARTQEKARNWKPKR